ncbi:hypothetical protein F5Y12DRAFT_142312 [Xylaria sp. FL1777]|nr:hypothetical protein F5Y12DRAFT_142312 [Xylaria sp. FL1777]
MIPSLGAVQVVAVILSFTPLAIAAVGLRLWSRHIIHSPLAFNDYMAILALILTIGENITSLIVVFIGISGVHVSEVLAKDPSLLVIYLKNAIPGEILWAAANTAVKLSIVSLYTTLFPNQRFTYVCYATMVASVALFIIVFLEAFFLCTPVEYNWDKTIPGGVCNQGVAFLVSGIMNLIIDAFIVILPMPLLFKLQLPLFKRLGVAVMFSLGAVICILSLFRIIALQTWDLSDVTFGSPQVSIYSSIEPTIGVINACLPTIKPAIYKLCGKEVYEVSKSHPKDTMQSGLDNDQGNSTASGTYSGPFYRLKDQKPLTPQADNEVSAGNERAVWEAQSLEIAHETKHNL